MFDYGKFGRTSEGLRRLELEAQVGSAEVSFARCDPTPKKRALGKPTPSPRCIWGV